MAAEKKISQLPPATAVNDTDYTVLVDGSTGANKRATMAQILAGGTGGGISWVNPPASLSSAGTAGQAAYDADYLYICVATNIWRVTPLSST